MEMTDQKFKLMSKKDKKDYLSNDLIERIIRIEQRVSARFGKLVSYSSTEYYKSLTNEQKSLFEKYLKSKKKKKLFFSSMFLLPLLSVLLLNLGLTGNVVKDDFGTYNPYDYAIAGFLIVSFLAFIVFIYLRKSRKKKFDRYFTAIENIGYKKSKAPVKFS
jgi:hypothetical protein